MKKVITILLTFLLLFSSCLITRNTVYAEDNNEETVNETSDNEVIEETDQDIEITDDNQEINKIT